MSDSLTFIQACKSVARRLRESASADVLEKDALLAIIEDDPQEAERLLQVMERRNALGLRVITGGKAVLPPLSAKDNARPRSHPDPERDQ